MESVVYFSVRVNLCSGLVISSKQRSHLLTFEGENMSSLLDLLSPSQNHRGLLEVSDTVKEKADREGPLGSLADPQAASLWKNLVGNMLWETLLASIQCSHGILESKSPSF